LGPSARGDSGRRPFVGCGGQCRVRGDDGLAGPWCETAARRVVGIGAGADILESVPGDACTRRRRAWPKPNGARPPLRALASRGRTMLRPNMCEALPAAVRWRHHDGSFVGRSALFAHG